MVHFRILVKAMVRTMGSMAYFTVLLVLMMCAHRAVSGLAAYQNMQAQKHFNPKRNNESSISQITRT